jgi:hypothetical protein
MTVAAAPAAAAAQAVDGCQPASLPLGLISRRLDSCSQEQVEVSEVRHGRFVFVWGHQSSISAIAVRTTNSSWPSRKASRGVAPDSESLRACSR